MRDPRREQLLWRVQSSGFVMVDLNLYLDTHPCDPDAIEHMNKFREINRKAVAAFEEEFGPLTMKSESATKNDKWKWVNDPWPWEMEC